MGVVYLYKYILDFTNQNFEQYAQEMHKEEIRGFNSAFSHYAVSV